MADNNNGGQGDGAKKRDGQSDLPKEITETLSALRTEIGEANVDLAARLDTIEQSRSTEADDVKKMRTEMDDIKATAKERENTILEMERRNRIRMTQDPVQQRNEALEIFGAMGRRALARQLGYPLGRQYEDEGKRLDEYLRQRAERATVQVSTSATFLPTVLQAEIYNTLEEVSPLLGLTDFNTGFPAKGNWVSLTGRPTLQPKRASSDTDMTQSDPTFSEFSWSCDEGYIFFPVDNWLLELSPLAFGTKLLEISRNAFLAGLTDWLINGDGTASYNSITGILSDAVNVVRTSSTTFAGTTNADLRKVMRSTLVRARRGGSFLGGPYLIDICDEIDRTGKTPVLRENGDGTFRVKGHAVIEDEGMPDETDSGADSAFFAFGDPKTWGVILAADGMRIDTSTEVLFKRNQTCFRTMSQLDIIRKPGKTWALAVTKES